MTDVEDGLDDLYDRMLSVMAELLCDETIEGRTLLSVLISVDTVGGELVSAIKTAEQYVKNRKEEK